MKKADDWFLKRVRLKERHPTDKRVGTIIGEGKLRTWWLVEWSDGSKKLAAQRHLEILTDEEANDLLRDQ